LDRLRRAAEAGDLTAACRRHGVTLLVAFGSVLRQPGVPRDLDLAARFAADPPDVLGFLDEISTFAGTSAIDLMDLGRAGPVARERALVGAAPLVEDHAGAFARAQLAAIMERLDTDWLRRMDLDLMAR
jgi:predicted nucleotidyltransferase